MYRPLPDELTIKSSPIEGLGLFATKEIKANTFIGITHIRDEQFENKYIRTPLGGFYNHSMKPNTQKTQEGHKWFLDVIEDVKMGDEILVTYTLYKLEDMNKISIVSQFMQED